MGTDFAPNSDYPALELYLGTYLEALVGHDYRDMWDALRAFLREEDQWGPTLANEAQQVLDLGYSEGELESLFEEELDTLIDPRPYGFGFATFLAEIIRVAADPSHNPSPRPLPSD